jgi:hypothetical protein
LGLFTHWGEESSSQVAVGQLGLILESAGSKMLTVKIPMSSAIESNLNTARNAKQAYEDLVEEVIAHVTAH